MESNVRLNDFDASVKFSRGAGIIKFGVWYLLKMIFFLTSVPFPSNFKSAILRGFGARVGRNVVIKPRVNIHFPWKLVLGDNVWIGEEVFILNFEQLEVGNNVCISQRVFLCGGNHDFRDPAFSYRNGPIKVHDGCWLGASAFIGPSVTIGVDTVISAGSVVTSDLPSNGVYKGNPLIYCSERWK